MKKVPVLLLLILAAIISPASADTRKLQLSEDQKVQIRAIKKIRLEIKTKYKVHRNDRAIEFLFKTNYREMRFPVESNLRDLFACIPITVVAQNEKSVGVLRINLDAEFFYREWQDSYMGTYTGTVCTGAKAKGQMELLSPSGNFIFRQPFSGQSHGGQNGLGIDHFSLREEGRYGPEYGPYISPAEAFEGAMYISSTDGTSMNRILMGVIYDCFGQEPILKIYKSNRPGLSELAGAMLPGLGDAAVLQLIDVITDPKSSRSQIKNAAYTLGKMGDKRAVRPLIDCLRTHRFWNVDAEGNMTGGAVVLALMKITGYVPEESFDPNTIYQVWNDWWNKQPK